MNRLMLRLVDERPHWRKVANALGVIARFGSKPVQLIDPEHVAFDRAAMAVGKLGQRSANGRSAFDRRATAASLRQRRHGIGLDRLATAAHGPRQRRRLSAWPSPRSHRNGRQLPRQRRNRAPGLRPGSPCHSR